MRIALILRTPSDIVKFSSLIREQQHFGLDFFVLHTSQHYSYLMDRVLIKQLCLPVDDFNLDVGSGSHGGQTGLMLERLEKIAV